MTIIATTTMLLAGGAVTQSASAAPVAPSMWIDCNALTTATPMIALGSSGVSVEKAQCYLNYTLTGADLVRDGDFGALTDAATRRFQRCAGLKDDGIIGPKTWTSLRWNWDHNIVAC